jgi:hypothetical protein
VSRYTGGLIELPKATDDVTAVAELLSNGFEVSPLLDPTRTDVNTLLEGLPQSVVDGQVLVAVWSGHGQPSANGGLRLPTCDTTSVDLGGVSSGDVMTACALSGASRILLVLDTSYSGKASLVVAAIAEQIMRDRPPQGRYVWVGVLAACAPEETARDGVLGGVLRELLVKGPTDPQARVQRWSPHNRYVYGEDLGDGLLKQWPQEGPVAGQQPQFLRWGSP